MINSGRTVAVLGGLLVLGAAAMFYAVWRLNVEGGSSAWSIAVGIGSVVLLLVFIFWLVALKAWRKTAKLMRPEMQIARWLISPAMWTAFQAQERGPADDKQSLPNLLKPGRKPVSGPVEVIAAKGGMLIGGKLFDIEPRGMMALKQVGWQQGPPECLELVLLETTMSNTGSSVRTQTRWVAVRVPAEPEARAAAVASYHHYAAFLEADVISNPRPLRIMVRVTVILALALFAIGGLGVLLDRLDTMPGSIVPVLMALVGIMGGIGALIVAGVVWAVMLRKR